MSLSDEIRKLLKRWKDRDAAAFLFENAPALISALEAAEKLPLSADQKRIYPGMTIFSDGGYAYQARMIAAYPLDLMEPVVWNALHSNREAALVAQKKEPR